MSFSASFLMPLREFFLLERAESTVSTYAPAQFTQVREHVEAAARRLEAARRVAQAAPASELLKIAVIHLLLARASAREERCAEPSREELLRSLPEFVTAGAGEARRAEDLERARAALSSSDPLYLDRLPIQEVESTRAGLERLAGFLRHRLEARSLVYLRAARWGRLAACCLLAMYVSYRAVTAAVAPWNIARNKPVTVSTYRINPPDGHELVDGSFPLSYGVQTDREPSPHVDIDLQAVYRIQSIKVYNRGDGWQDEGLPIAVELSIDGNYYYLAGRRETHFDREPPWVVRVGKLPARYVRIRGERAGSYLALSQVEVFGKK